MLEQYGHAKIEWGDQVFNLSPTFANIAKIGSPTEIIDTFKDFVSTPNIIVKYAIALNVLNCCSDKEIPQRLSGGIKYSDRKNKMMIVNPEHGESMINDVLILANHCLVHGVCGKIQTKKKTKGAALTEFDAYSYMELGRIHLGLSLDDAARMTMTEFLRLMNAKFPPEIDEDQATEEEQLQLLEWLDNKKVH